jgi:predicted transcriptional regulator
MPLLIDILNRNKISSKAISILTNNSELAEKMAKAAIREIPEDKRDELLADILTEYKQEIIDAVNRAILKYYIKAELKDIGIHGKELL